MGQTPSILMCHQTVRKFSVDPVLHGWWLHIALNSHITYVRTYHSLVHKNTGKLCIWINVLYDWKARHLKYNMLTYGAVRANLIMVTHGEGKDVIIYYVPTLNKMCVGYKQYLVRNTSFIAWFLSAVTVFPPPRLLGQIHTGPVWREREETLHETMDLLVS